jgi:hypothetical protein
MWGSARDSPPLSERLIDGVFARSRLKSFILEAPGGNHGDFDLEAIWLHAVFRWLLFYNDFVDPVRELGRSLLLLGALFAVIGTVLYFSGRLPFRIGKLPGDIIHRGEHTTFYFPIVTCLVLSLGLSLLFWLYSHFKR